jgi:hypothetical protein
MAPADDQATERRHLPEARPHGPSGASPDAPNARDHAAILSQMQDGRWPRLAADGLPGRSLG